MRKSGFVGRIRENYHMPPGRGVVVVAAVMRPGATAEGRVVELGVDYAARSAGYIDTQMYLGCREVPSGIKGGRVIGPGEPKKDTGGTGVYNGSEGQRSGRRKRTAVS